ncbi:uncharacterized protein LOC143810148 [Ranitomeya variabilis]|uniref:uncharacterized protein LOC143810148 n=1 Tax=Ranitomeya variabilis TaxID=490064 RepID=UPI0040576D66
MNALPHLKSCLSKNRRESAVLYSPEACEEIMVNSAMECRSDDADNMQTIYKAAQLIRKSIANFTTEVNDKNTITVTSDIHDVPAELYSAIRWIITGPINSLETQRRTKIVDRAALTMSQNIMYEFKSKRQDSQLDPEKNGYHKGLDGQLKPTMTDVLPAPKAIIEMISCQCKHDCSSSRCSCRKNNLSCTDLCQCDSECMNDEDTQTKYETDDDSDGGDM